MWNLIYVGYRDIDYDQSHFNEIVFKEKCHFTDNINRVIQFVESITSSSSGGNDIAEDHLGGYKSLYKLEFYK